MPDTPPAMRQVERWFVSRGVPNFIYQYQASTDVFTRAAPLAVVIFLFEMVTVFDPDRRGLSEVLAVLGAIAGFVTLVLVVNRLRFGRALTLPARVGWVEIAAFVLVPPILSVVPGANEVRDALVLIGINLVLVLLAYLIVSFGFIAMTRWALGQMFRQLGDVVALLLRSLPLVLIFSTFLFLNAELWQVASNFTRLSFQVTLALLALVVIAFLAIRVPRELEGIGGFESWSEVTARAEDAPLEPALLEVADGPCDIPPLVRRERINLVLVFVFSQLVQIVLVSLIIGAFYLLFGIFVVREQTILQWTELGDDGLAKDILVTFGGSNRFMITRTLVRVASFLAAFGALQFTVQALTDDVWRREFFTEVTGEVRQNLAVRALYLRAYT